MDNLNIKSLPIDLKSFGFVSREKINGEPVKNRCGRDFFYYVFTYFYPDIYNPGSLSPQVIEKECVFGLRLPSLLIWTGLSFYKIPEILKKLGLRLEVNNRVVKNFTHFILALLPVKLISYNKGMDIIRSTIDSKHVCGIDISVALGGLVDHVMFVYGYDNENLYVFDTHQVNKINYEKMTATSDPRFIMKLPYSEIKKKWSIFNRIWIIKKAA